MPLEPLAAPTPPVALVAVFIDIYAAQAINTAAVAPDAHIELVAVAFAQATTAAIVNHAAIVAPPAGPFCTCCNCY